MRTAHPWAELLIALCLVVTSGVPAVATAVIATALSVAYLVLVVRAVQSPEPTDCACFGVVGSEQVSGWTVLRNVLLLALSGICLWVAQDGRSPLQWALGLGSDAWWLGAMVAAAAMTGLVVHPGAPKPVDDLDLEDYERTEIPHVPVTLHDGSVVSLRELAVTRPKLILAVSGTCSSCLPTIEAAPHWRERLPELDIHLLFGSADEPVSSSSHEPETLYDPQRYVYEALHMRGTPSAVLLGADGMLAGGPVAGHDVISAFVADVEAELASLRLVTR